LVLELSSQLNRSLGCMRAWVVVCHWKVFNFCQKNCIMKGLQFWSTKIALWRVCNFGPQRLHYEGFVVLVHKNCKKVCNFCQKNCTWVIIFIVEFVDVGLKVSNHVKFSVCFYLFFYSYFGCVYAWKDYYF